YNANSFVSGKLSYALSKLENGFHTLTLRAWDVINNMGEASIDFEVVDGKELTITQMMNYPNPFTTSTHFVFEHNQPEALLNIRVQIFSISGTLVKTIIQNQQNTGFRSDPLPWDGRNEHGGKLAAGIYVYKVQVQTSSNGQLTEKIGKIAILQ
ncbi:MAG: T9SS type A sorting domain-containing protein, partial [Bacteroidales bacterium]|nr:T9SS type A sorting domain-containing protein [Bacteroidales bacterium]